MSAAVHPSRVSAPRCIDCAHSRRLAFQTKLYCDHPSTPVDPRDGSPQISAIDMRDGPGYLARLGVLQPCGQQGALFEARTPGALPPERARWDGVPRVEHWLADLDKINIDIEGLKSIVTSKLEATPAPSSMRAEPGHALQPQGMHEGSAHGCAGTEENDQRSVVCSRQDFDDLVARHARRDDLDKVDRHPLGALTVLGVVVRRGEVHHLLTEFRHMLAAVGRLHGDAQDGVPLVIYSEGAKPSIGWRGETVTLAAEALEAHDWQAWHGHGVILTLPPAAPAKAGS